MEDLLYDQGQCPRQKAMMNWAGNTNGLHNIIGPDYHRLQVEHWIWRNRGELGHYVMDVGQSVPRRWVSDRYFTLGFSDSDLIGDLLALPLASESLDGIILTEVLEHCTNPFQAVEEAHRVLKPGGLLLVTSPFVWPWHGCGEYEDYWRFTDQGWELLLKKFNKVKIESCQWTDEGQIFYDQLRRWECFGDAQQTKATTGYLVEARK